MTSASRISVEPSSASDSAELDFQIDEENIFAPPRMGEDVEHEPREIGHLRKFGRRGQAGIDDLLGGELRVVIGIVFEEIFDQARREDRSRLDTGIAFQE